MPTSCAPTSRRTRRRWRERRPRGPRGDGRDGRSALMGAFLRRLAANLAAGARLAVLVPVRRLAFRVDVPQLLALFVVSALVDVGADAMRYGEGAAFSWYGLGNEVYSGGVLVLSAAVLSLVNRDRSLTLGVPVIALSTFPLLQLANAVPWDRW